MIITRKTVADKLAAYLHHEITLPQLVDWAEGALMDSTFAENETDVLRDVIGRLGVADVRAFGLTWEDCEDLFKQLGFSTRIDVIAA